MKKQFLLFLSLFTLSPVNSLFGMEPDYSNPMITVKNTQGFSIELPRAIFESSSVVQTEKQVGEMGGYPILNPKAEVIVDCSKEDLEFLSEVTANIQIGQCTICLAENVMVTKPACGHQAHATCLAAWLIKSPNCSTCNVELDLDNWTESQFSAHLKDKDRLCKIIKKLDLKTLACGLIHMTHKEINFLLEMAERLHEEHFPNGISTPAEDRAEAQNLIREQIRDAAPNALPRWLGPTICGLIGGVATTVGCYYIEHFNYFTRHPLVTRHKTKILLKTISAYCGSCLSLSLIEPRVLDNHNNHLVNEFFTAWMGSTIITATVIAGIEIAKARRH